MEHKEQPAPIHISLSVTMHNFLRALAHLFWLPLLLAALLGMAVGFYTNYSYAPRYAVTATFAVRAEFTSSMDLTSSSNYLNANAAAQLAATFPYVRDSDNTRLLLQQALGKETINGTITASSIANASLFTVRVASSSAQDAYDILNAVIEIYPQAASPILGDTQIQILDRPTAPPTKPVNSNEALAKGLRMGLAGMILGLALVFAISLTRRTVHSEEDLGKLINLKCLAYLPAVKLKKRSNRANLNLVLTNPRVEDGFSESIRNLRVKTQKALRSRGGSVLLLTSTLPEEGKTTVAANLALSMAAVGKRVVLIDGDLRKQPLKPLLGLTEPSDGMLEVLTGKAENFRLLNVPDSTLLLISGDSTTTDPHRLLDSRRLKQLMQLLREKFDYVLIDTPPAGMLSDAAALSKYADATLYVVRQDLANTTQILNSIQALDAAGTDIIGCVLNRTQAGTTRSGYASKYSSYGYGYKNSYGYSGYGKKQYTGEPEEEA